jgi:hypothetical protein
MSARIDAGRAGIGLRSPHYVAWQERPPPVSFLEVHSENYFADGGQPLTMLTRWRADYPVSCHGVGLSLGSASGLDRRHLDKLARLVERIEPVLVSEHLCWAGMGGRFANDLLPLPFTAEALEVVVANIGRAQDRLKRRILVENVSTYLVFEDSDMTEWEFVCEAARRSGAGILFDLNNVYVNAVNHGFDPARFIEAVPPDLVGEIHLAGFQDTGDILIDTHGAPVSDAVWTLYRSFIGRAGARPTLIEWDTDLPAPEVLLAEAGKANDILRQCSTGHAA